MEAFYPIDSAPSRSSKVYAVIAIPLHEQIHVACSCLNSLTANPKKSQLRLSLLDPSR